MDNSANNYDLIIFLGEQGEERHEIRKEWYNGELYYTTGFYLYKFLLSARMHEGADWQF